MAVHGIPNILLTVDINLIELQDVETIERVMCDRLR